MPLVQRMDELACTVPMEAGDVLLFREDVWHRTQDVSLDRVGKMVRFQALPRHPPSLLRQPNTKACTLACTSHCIRVGMNPSACAISAYTLVAHICAAFIFDIMRFPLPESSLRGRAIWTSQGRRVAESEKAPMAGAEPEVAMADEVVTDEAVAEERLLRPVHDWLSAANRAYFSW